MPRKNPISDVIRLLTPRLLLLLVLLPAAGYAEPKKLGPDLAEKEVVHIPGVQLSENMQEFLAGIETPEDALEKAREHQKNGQFGLAKLVLQHGIELARSSGSDFVELSNELEYDMPMLQAKELLVLGKPDQAEPVLERLAEKFSSSQKRTNEISALLGALEQSRFLAAANSDSEDEVTRNVRWQMKGFYKQYGAFPNYAQLNKLIPANDKSLQNFEIIYYKSVPEAYRMVLRNLYKKENLLKIEATGLMK